MGIALELTQGTARDFPFQVTNPDGTVPTGIFLSSDVLTASVWAGANDPAVGEHRDPAAGLRLDLGPQRSVPDHLPGHRLLQPGDR